MSLTPLGSSVDCWPHAVHAAKKRKDNSFFLQLLFSLDFCGESLEESIHHSKVDEGVGLALGVAKHVSEDFLEGCQFLICGTFEDSCVGKGLGACDKECLCICSGLSTALEDPAEDSALATVASGVAACGRRRGCGSRRDWPPTREHEEKEAAASEVRHIMCTAALSKGNYALCPQSA